MAAIISGYDTKQRRISTQALLQKIYRSLEQGETEFEITSSGHHNIGGPLWTEDGRPLNFGLRIPDSALVLSVWKARRSLLKVPLLRMPAGSIPVPN